MGFGLQSVGKHYFKATLNREEAMTTSLVLYSALAEAAFFLARADIRSLWSSACCFPSDSGSTERRPFTMWCVLPK